MSKKRKSDPRPKNPVEFDYKNLEYKKYPNKIYINRDFNDPTMPEEAKAPNPKKYDSKGNYIKHKYVAEEKSETKEKKKISMGEVMRGASKTAKEKSSK